MFFKGNKKRGNDQNNQSAYIGPVTTCDGVLKFSGEMYVDGVIKGEIESDGTLVLGKGSHVSGTINVNNLYCDGTLEGDVVVRNKAVIYKNAYLDGFLHTKYLSIEEGAFVDGKIKTQERSEGGHGKVLEMNEVNIKTAATG